MFDRRLIQAFWLISYLIVWAVWVRCTIVQNLLTIEIPLLQIERHERKIRLKRVHGSLDLFEKLEGKFTPRYKLSKTEFEIKIRQALQRTCIRLGMAFVHLWLSARECYDSKKGFCEKLLVLTVMLFCFSVLFDRWKALGFVFLLPRVPWALALYCAFCLCIFLALMKAAGAVENSVEYF